MNDNTHNTNTDTDQGLESDLYCLTLATSPSYELSKGGERQNSCIIYEKTGGEGITKKDKNEIFLVINISQGNISITKYKMLENFGGDWICGVWGSFDRFSKEK